MRFFNPKGQLVYKVSRPDNYCETAEYYLEQFHIPKIGYSILMTWDCEPSYPGTGAHAQLLGLNSKQQIVTLTSVMSPDGDGTDPSGYKPVTIDLSKTQKNIPCVEVKRSVGYFDIPMYYEIHGEGVKDEDEAPHNIDTAHVPIVYFTAQLEDSSQIKLYTTIDENGQNAITLKISKMSKVKFLYATYKDGWWLRAQIDGHGGFVYGNKDFETLGLRNY